MRGDQTVQAADFEQAARRAWLDIWEKAQRAVVVTRRAVRSGLRGGLEPFENVLLSPSGRERVHATATFALIFLFAVSSVDFLIAGGAEFGAPARAAPRQILVQSAPQTRDRAEVPAARDEEATPTEIAAPLAEATQTSVTPVSQSFFAPLSETASAPAGGVLVSLDAHQREASPPGDAALVGETAEQSGAEPSRPQKEEPRSPRIKAT
jgi:hypothetical protein